MVSWIDTCMNFKKYSNVIVESLITKLMGQNTISYNNFKIHIHIFLFDFKNGTPGFSILFFYLAISHNKTITKIVKNVAPKDFDPHLKKVALSTFLFAVLIALKLISE